MGPLERVYLQLIRMVIELAHLPRVSSRNEIELKKNGLKLL